MADSKGPPPREVAAPSGNGSCLYGELTSFPRAVQAKDGEIVVFSWIVYESREQRDSIVVKATADPRLKAGMSNMPFDGKRMIYGGFRRFLEL